MISSVDDPLKGGIFWAEDPVGQSVEGIIGVPAAPGLRIPSSTGGTPGAGMLCYVYRRTSYLVKKYLTSK